MNPRRLFGMLPYIQRFVVGYAVDGIVAVSNAVADYWRPIRCPIWVVYNGVDSYKPSLWPSYYSSRLGVRDVLIAGSLSHEKGHLVAVEAMRLLGSRVKEFHLWIAGGPLDEVTNLFAGELRKKIKQYDLEKHVTLLGYVSDLREFAPLVWVALQQRITPEPCGLWILEALSAGLPIIASDTGGTAELARHELESLLVPPGNPEAVADAMLRLADDNDLRERLAENALRRAEQFTVQRLIKNISRVYGEPVFL